jgi:hypothetical protein
VVTRPAGESRDNERARAGTGPREQADVTPGAQGGRYSDQRHGGLPPPPSQWLQTPQ